MPMETRIGKWGNGFPREPFHLKKKERIDKVRVKPVHHGPEETRIET